MKPNMKNFDRMKRLVFLMMPLAVAALVSCGRSASVDGKGRSVFEVKFNSVKNASEVNISEFVEEPEFVALESTPEAYFSGWQYTVSDNYIRTGGGYGKVSKLYDRHTGKYLCNVGFVGNGPGEYTNTYHGQIDEADSTIWQIPWNASKILGFDLATGKFKEEIPLPYSAPKGVFKVDAAKGEVIVAVLPFDGVVDNVAWKQDKAGNVLWKIPVGNLAVTPDFSNEIESHGGVDGAFDLLINTWGGRRDTLYVIEEGKLSPVFTVDFGVDEVKGEQQYRTVVNEDAPMHSYMMLPGHFVTRVAYPEKNKFGYGVGESAFLVTDRKTGKTVKTLLYNDYLAEKLEFLNVSGGYVIDVFDAETFMETGEKALESGRLSEKSKASVSAILKDLKPESNYVIALYKIRVR